MFIKIVNKNVFPTLERGFCQYKNSYKNILSAGPYQSRMLITFKLEKCWSNAYENKHENDFQWIKKKP